MPTSTVSGSQFVWSLYDTYANRAAIHVEYFGLKGLASENWLNSASYDPATFYQISYRSEEGSRISARQNIWSGGVRESVNVIYSTGDQLIVNHTENKNIGTRSETYTDKFRIFDSYIYKSFGERSNPLDDTTMTYDWVKQITVTGTAANSANPNGRSTQVSNETERFSFANAEYVQSGTVVSAITRTHSSYEFDESREDRLISELGVFNVSNYVVLDKLEYYKLSIQKFVFQESFQNNTRTFSLGATNARVVTDDYTLTAASIGTRALTADEAQRLESTALAPADAESMASVRAGADIFFEPIILKANNVVSIKAEDGYVFDAGEGNDKIIGSFGDDGLIGGLGNDTLNGGAGDDVLTGGAGIDRLTGGAGGDIFLFSSTGDFSISSRLDLITDFTKGEDQISLLGVDGDRGIAGIQSFAFVASAPTSSGLRQAWATGSGNNYVLNLSNDSDVDPEFQIQITLTGVNPGPITAADLILV